MLHLRHFIRLFVILAVLATAVAAASSPGSAQSGLEVITYDNVETSNSGWEVRVTARTLGNCTPTSGPKTYVTGWLSSDGTAGEVIDTDTCTYEISAVARNTSSHPGKVCDAELQWEGGSFTRGKITSNNRGSATKVEVQHYGGTSPVCSSSIELAFTIDPKKIVQALPSTGADANLQARAERAAAITKFRVEVKPDSSTADRAGCNQSAALDVLGDGEEVTEALEPVGSGVTCKWRATVVNAPAPFKVIDATGEPFSSSDVSGGKIAVSLDGLVQLPYNRIAIIQDVVGSGNSGGASYTVTRSCAGVAALPPTNIGTGGSGIYQLPGGQTVATLNEGRYTVHAPNYANFGPGAVYPAVATSTTSSTIGACSVTVTVGGLPADCSVAGGTTRTLTWSAATPLEHFDFEFDIYCGGAQPPAVTPGLPPTVPDDGTTEPDTGDATGSADLRIVARLLSSGKIEFGLQQQGHDNAWGARQFPSARLFPADTAVGRWLVSSPITLSVATSADAFDQEIAVRIVARKLDNRKVEFGLQQRDNGSWSDRMLPARRYFPPTATVGAWLGSSTLTLVTSMPMTALG